MRFAELVPAEARIVELPGGLDIGGGTGPGWGKSVDGPVWLPDPGCWAFSDGGRSRRLTWLPGSAPRVLHQDTGRAMGTAVDPEGRLVACEWERGRVVRHEADGSVSVLVDAVGGMRLNHADDLAIAADGTIYFTDVRIVTHRPLPEGTVGHSGVYRLRTGGGLPELLVGDLVEPGGLALSPDGEVLYVSDPRGNRLLAIQAREDGGEARVFATLAAGPRSGIPLGMAVDRHGNLYAGGPGGVWVLDPHGQALGVLRHPASRTTNLVFGGPDNRSLFITTLVGAGVVELTVEGGPGPRPAPVTTGPELSMAMRVERIDHALDRVVAPGSEIVELASGGFTADLGGGSNFWSRSLEGTLWSQAEGALLFSDIGNCRVLRWSLDGGLSVFRQPSGHANGSTLDQQGRLVSCEQGPERRVTRLEPDGTLTVLADRWESKRLGRPNDVVVKSDGTVYFTAPWWDFGDRATREIDFNGVFMVSSDLRTVAPVVRDFQTPNGLAFSPDESVLYVNDSARMQIRSFELLPDGSLDLASDRIFFQFPGSHDDGVGGPDGMKVDVEGNVYCGGPNGLWIIDPGGRHLGTLRHGATQTNNLCFGDEDWKTLYWVSWSALYKVRLEVGGVPVPARAVEATAAC
jgi:gluconolactonase